MSASQTVCWITPLTYAAIAIPAGEFGARQLVHILHWVEVSQLYLRQFADLEYREQASLKLEIRA